MKNQSVFSLVNGNFTQEEALEVLMNLYSSKINFHELKNFSSQERFGHPDAHSQQRLPELKESMKQISKLMKELRASDSVISIQSDVHVTVHENAQQQSLQQEVNAE